jgi:hypothetical protein
MAYDLFDLVFGQRGGAQQREERNPVRSGDALRISGA